MSPAILAAPQSGRGTETRTRAHIPVGPVVSRRAFTRAGLGAGLLAAMTVGAGSEPARAATTSTTSTTSTTPTTATVQHGTNPNVARPTATVVTWVGAVRPMGALNNDRWYLS